jgi:hypothetical protein
MAERAAHYSKMAHMRPLSFYAYILQFDVCCDNGSRDLRS